MGSWKKLGCLYSLNKPYSQLHPHSHSKLQTHVANPLPILIKDNVYRIFFSSRDSDNRSSVGAVDIDIISQEIIQEYSKPFFEYGPKGSFYSDGVSIGNCYRVKNQRYMLFMGWQNPPKKHWRGDIGRLIVNDNLELKLENSSAFISSDAIDPVSLSYPWVEEEASGLFHMWYGSTQQWSSINDEMIHTIKYASSKDGHRWVKHGDSIPYTIGEAQAFSRPTVARMSENQLSMWFSYRSGSGEKYRIGRANCFDSENWQLDLEGTGIDVSKDGWDSEMIEYPFVFHHKSELYMLYNGNGYGASGFGIAIWSK